MSSYRGVTLSTVLIVSTIILLVATTIATVAILNLTMASSFADGAQADLLARAAVTQYLHEQSEAATSVVSMTGRPDLLARYRQPVFPDGASHLPGTVTVTFDTSQPWYSIDNSTSTDSAAGWMDVGTEGKSVPPLSVDLMMTVQTGRKLCHYEAIVGQRWPYALTSGGRVLMDDTGGQPSVVHGPVYVTKSTDEMPVTQRNTVVPTGQVKLLVDSTSFQTIFGLNKSDTTHTQVYVPETALSPPPIDRLDTPAKSGTIVNPLQAADRIRYNVDVDVSKLLQRPPVPQITPLRMESALGVDDNGRITYILNQDLVLGTPSTGQPAFQPQAGSTFYVDGNLVNHGYTNTIGQCCQGPGTKKLFETPYGLTLNNCTLYVDGNLDLSYNSTDPTQLPVALQGQNATLIVAGSILIAHGSFISAGDNAMVLYCERIVANASGSFQGLIVAEDSAIFSPVDKQPTGLTITGGVVTGGRTVSLLTYLGSNGSDVQVSGLVNFAGTNLSSTVIQYDARFLRTLHGSGTPTLTLLRRLP